ncbi:MAG TPA: dienelactone hydrolase family protein [Opitutaceae bacterium]
MHQGQSVVRGGAPLRGAKAAVILVHGRGAAAEDIYSLGEDVSVGLEGVALLAPEAAGNTWYPQRFLAPLSANEPWLGSALAVLGGLVSEAVQSGVPRERVALIGFSQGACLSLEFAARNPRRYGAVIGLSGALIGPPGVGRDLGGSLDGTPVYLGCGDRDAHIPISSVEESAVILADAGAKVTKSLFVGMGHTVNAEEMAVMQRVVRAL